MCSAVGLTVLCVLYKQLHKCILYLRDRFFKAPRFDLLTFCDCPVNPRFKTAHFHRHYLTFFSAEYRALVERLMSAAHMDLDAVRLDQGSWKQQFYQAMNVNGGEIDDAGAFDYFMHFFTFAWKVRADFPIPACTPRPACLHT